MAAYNIYEAKTAFSALIDRAEHGEETIVARAGKPVARIAPLEKEKTAAEPEFIRPAPGFAKGEFTDLIEALDEPWPEDIQRAFGMID